MNVPRSPAGLIAAFDASLSAAERPVVEAARRWSEAHDAPLYAVGGTVRDLLLARPHLDVDLALDGDAAALGRALAEAFSIEATVHEAFGTAVLDGGDWHLDVARTRAERYSYPGALPEVQPAPILADLGRRDFTVHAIAIPLTGASAGALLDPFDGQGDLATGRLRVLHALSFVDDPTRILRGVRYTGRFGWLFEAETLALALRHGGLLATVSPTRIGHEIGRTLGEDRPEDALAVLAALPAACAAIGLDLRDTLDRIASVFRSLRAGDAAMVRASECLAALQAIGALDRTFLQRVELTEPQTTAVRDAARVLQVVREWTPEAPGAVALADALDRLSSSAVRGVAAALACDAVAGMHGRRAALAAELLHRYLREWRGLRPRLNGDDLIALGVPRGAAVGRALARLRAARLLGETQTEHDERALVEAFLKQGEP